MINEIVKSVAEHKFAKVSIKSVRTVLSFDSMSQVAEWAKKYHLSVTLDRCEDKLTLVIRRAQRLAF